MDISKILVDLDITQVGIVYCTTSICLDHI